MCQEKVQPERKNKCKEINYTEYKTKYEHARKRERRNVFHIRSTSTPTCSSSRPKIHASFITNSAFYCCHYFPLGSIWVFNNKVGICASGYFSFLTINIVGHFMPILILFVCLFYSSSSSSSSSPMYIS